MDIYQSEYLRFSIAFLGTIILIYILCTKKNIINLNKVYSTKRKFVEKHYNIFNNVVKIVALILILISIFLIVIPSIKDLKRFINKDFEIGNFEVLSGDIEKSFYKRRHINVINMDTGEKLEIDVGYTPINIGDKFIIQYLPNILVGEIISEY
ncbi:MAG: hypothetical protein N2749_07400 [Clostridia bacterium]|nr:hypothetical protein [Clostridia bacterium]